MTMDILKDFFMWCSIINMALLMVSFMIFWLARDWAYRIHSKWFKVSQEQFDKLWYGVLGFYKMSIFMFNIIPYIALLIITK